jgi:hypothetical protein
VECQDTTPTDSDHQELVPYTSSHNIKKHMTQTGHRDHITKSTCTYPHTCRLTSLRYSPLNQWVLKTHLPYCLKFPCKKDYQGFAMTSITFHDSTCINSKFSCIYRSNISLVLHCHWGYKTMFQVSLSLTHTHTRTHTHTPSLFNPEIISVKWFVYNFKVSSEC